MNTASPVALPIRRVERCMGTVFSFDVRGPGVDPRGLDAAIDWLHWVDRTFSTYQPGSAISRLGDGSLRLDDADARVRDVLTACRELRDATNGYFDAEAGGRLDPSGYVKGWAIAEASRLLSAHGSTSHCVNGGGDVQCVGVPEPGRSWRIGIADPAWQVRKTPRRGGLAAIAQGEGIAVATSGAAERGAHIIDPHTGRPATHWASVTVMGRDIAQCDAFATAAIAMGPAAVPWLQGLSGHRALCIRPDGTSWASP